MHDYQRQFIEFVIAERALRFGEFRLKSGRTSPYFFDAGLFNTGSAVSRLGRFYAQTIVANISEPFMLFGPAYKGIPLATSAAVALADAHGRDVAFAFNRKEAKDHGEGGEVVGAPLTGRVLIIDDVITAGLSVAESVRVIRAAGADPLGVVIALDRRERTAEGEASALEAVSSRYGIPVHPIATVDHLVEFLAADPQWRVWADAIRDYRRRYGV